MSEEKMKIFWKTILKMTLKVQNTRFSWLEWVVNKSLNQAAKNPCDKLWKNFLSIFRDWKVHSRVSREGCRETLWVKLVTGASTCESVTKLSHENTKNLESCQNFWVAKASE